MLKQKINDFDLLVLQLEDIFIKEVKIHTEM